MLLAGGGGGRVARNLLPRADTAAWRRDQQKLHGKEDSSLQHSSLPNNPWWPHNLKGLRVSVLAVEDPHKGLT